MNPGIAALVAMAALFPGCSNGHEGDPRPDDGGAARHSPLGGMTEELAMHQMVRYVQLVTEGGQ